MASPYSLLLGSGTRGQISEKPSYREMYFSSYVTNGTFNTTGRTPSAKSTSRLTAFQAQQQPLCSRSVLVISSNVVGTQGPCLWFKMAKEKTKLRRRLLRLPKREPM
ncbi:hypothetical protein LSAT2_002783 [Lamellibrachia satsuma]|nr:hypothetical protein LSAT2_002783 [Lamellibrachia satsuma]